jgi:hypothetical protein
MPVMLGLIVVAEAAVKPPLKPPRNEGCFDDGVLDFRVPQKLEI